jgi:hypothetical protein
MTTTQTTTEINDYGTGLQIGEFVHYCGSITQIRGQLVEVEAIYPGGMLTLRTAVGQRMRFVRFMSIRKIEC